MDTQPSRSDSEIIRVLAGLCVRDPIRNEQAIADIKRTYLSWDRLLQLAGDHGVTALIYHCLTRHPDLQQMLTEMQLATLRQNSRNIILQNMRVETELARVSRAFDSQEIEHIIMKGPVLARETFDALGLRQFNDFDILVSKISISQVAPILQSFGYQSIIPINTIQLKKLKYFDKEITYVRTEEGRRNHEADIHWHFLRPAMQVPLDFETLWRQKIAVEISGKSYYTTNPTYTFLSICLQHGLGGGWSKLRRIADLDAMLRKWGDVINWQEIWRFAEKYDVQRVIHVGLFMASELFGAPISTDWRKNLRPETNKGTTSRLAEAELDLLFNEREYHHWRRNWTFRTRMGVRIKFQSLHLLDSLSPNYADEIFLPLPFKLRPFGFYYLVRPLRILFAGKNPDRFD